MSLDVKVMQMLDRFARMEESNDKKDNEALRYINQLPSHKEPYLRAAYVKYYFQAKRDYKAKAILERLDLFEQDI